MYNYILREETPDIDRKFMRWLGRQTDLEKLRVGKVKRKFP
jgi:hypothetical protein